MLAFEDRQDFLLAAAMPPKIFCWEKGDEADRQACMRLFGHDVLQTTFANGVTPEAMKVIYEKAERERINQRLRRMNVPRAKVEVNLIL